MSIRFAPLFVAFVVLAATAAGCGQTAGETCQLNSDCEGDLFCCRTGTVGTRGVCQEPDTSCLTTVDAGPGTDAGQSDAGTDAGEAEVDAGESDAGTDAGESDAGTDAGESDAGESDAGTDAGESDAGSSGT